MNQRIRELLKQAEERYPKHLAVAVPEVVLRQDALEKFAELLIQECIITVKKRYMGDNNREDMEALRCVSELKNHFGVEE